MKSHKADYVAFYHSVDVIRKLVGDTTTDGSAMKLPSGLYVEFLHGPYIDVTIRSWVSPDDGIAARLCDNAPTRRVRGAERRDPSRINPETMIRFSSGTDEVAIARELMGDFQTKIWREFGVGVLREWQQAREISVNRKRLESVLLSIGFELHGRTFTVPGVCLTAGFSWDSFEISTDAIKTERLAEAFPIIAQLCQLLEAPHEPR
jgi:hypothetical protein